MESDDAPYFKTVPSSPDEGELSETVIMKEEEGVADNERELRHRLMLKQKVKERTRTTSADEEELFTVQPGFQVYTYTYVSNIIFYGCCVTYIYFVSLKASNFCLKWRGENFYCLLVICEG